MEQLYTMHPIDAYIIKDSVGDVPSIPIALCRQGVASKPHQLDEARRIMHVMNWFSSVDTEKLVGQLDHLMTIINHLDADSEQKDALDSIEALLSSLLISCDDIEYAKQNAMKDEVEKIIIQNLSNIGMDVPSNIEDITQYVFEDVMETSDYPNFNDSDVVIGLRRYLEKDVK